MKSKDSFYAYEPVNTAVHIHVFFFYKKLNDAKITCVLSSLLSLPAQESIPRSCSLK